MEKSRGAYSLLRLPSLYEGVQWIAGARAAQEWLLHDHWNLRGFRGSVADIGCGTGGTFAMLPESRYIGFDINAAYIASAKERFGTRATFLHGDLGAIQEVPELRGLDVVLCIGVLHHLDDVEACEAVRFARRALRAGGRFLGVEPTYLIKQGRISRAFLGRDRGRNIRFQHEWDGLIRREFEHVESHVTTGLLRLPYTHFLYAAMTPEGR